MEKTNDLELETNILFRTGKLKSIIDASDISYSDLAKVLNIHYVTLNRWIKNPPNLSALVKILVSVGFTQHEIAEIRLRDFYLLNKEEVIESELSGVPNRYHNF